MRFSNLTVSKKSEAQLLSHFTDERKKHKSMKNTFSNNKFLKIIVIKIIIIYINLNKCVYLQDQAPFFFWPTRAYNGEKHTSPGRQYRVEWLWSGLSGIRKSNYYFMQKFVSKISIKKTDNFILLLTCFIMLTFLGIYYDLQENL